MNNEIISFYLQDYVDNLAINEIILENSVLHSVSPSTKNLVIATLIGSLFIGSYFKTALYTYMYNKGKELLSQPINLLILIKTLIDHSVCILMVTFFTSGLVLDVTFAEVFGEIWCNVPWYAGTFAATYRTFGALGIAVLRLFYIKYPYPVKNNENRMNFFYAVLTSSILISTIAAIGFGVGNGEFSRKQLNWNFCTGRSEEFREVTYNYSIITGAQEIQSDDMAKSIVIFGLVGVVAEFVCYVLLFKHLYDHDEKMLKSKLLPSNVIKQRNRTNAVTFLGQFYEFVAKCVRLALLMYTMLRNSNINYRLVMVISIWAEFGVVSIVEVMTSQNLKRNLPF